MADLPTSYTDLGFEDVGTVTRGTGRNWNTVVKPAAVARAASLAPLQNFTIATIG
jgi:uncharacterized protein (DUF1697 family)